MEDQTIKAEEVNDELGHWRAWRELYPGWVGAAGFGYGDTLEEAVQTLLQYEEEEADYEASL